MFRECGCCMNCPPRSSCYPLVPSHHIHAHRLLFSSPVEECLPHATVSVKLGQSAAGVCTLREWLWAQWCSPVLVHGVNGPHSLTTQDPAVDQRSPTVTNASLAVACYVLDDHVWHTKHICPSSGCHFCLYCQHAVLVLQSTAQSTADDQARSA
jgi:hypothetical protein